MKLNIPQVKNAAPRDKQYKLSDGGGLFLLVHPNGSKYWRLKYRFGGKEKLLALGKFPDVSLKEAREKRDDAKRQLRDMNDPGEAKKAQKREDRLKAENSFESVARDWWNHQQGRWSASHAQRVWQSLDNDVLPYIGRRPVSDLSTPEMLDLLRKIEKRGALDVAGRVLQRCSSVFRFAIQTHRAKFNPMNDLAGALKTRKKQHRLALTRRELPDFLRSLSAYDGHPITLAALKLLVLTFVRPGEVRFARWDEFDFDQKIWRIPGYRMKMDTEHLVPLSNQVIELLEELRPLSGQNDLLFPGERNRTKPISENTMIYAMYRMGYKSRATPHGFRTSASSILNEEGFTPDAIERQLSHMERNKVRGAYTQHAEYLPERVEMMAWWANYLEELEQGSNVIAGSFGKVVTSR